MHAAQLGVAGAVITFCWLALLNWSLITYPIVEDGDYAANSILVDQARHLHLLVGHFSRFGFNHPGPAILYTQALSDTVVHRFLGIAASSYGGQFVGIIALNSICVGTCAWIVSTMTGRAIDAVAFVGLVPILNFWEPCVLTSTWIPAVMVALFLVLTVSCAAIAHAQWRFLWVMVTAASMCVHAHVTLVPFAGLAVAVALLLARTTIKHSRVAGPTRGEILRALVVGGVFLVPIVVNLVVNWPGEFVRYARYLGRKDTFQPRSIGDVIDFVAGFWLRGGFWVGALAGLSIAGVLLAWWFRRQAADTFRLKIAAIVGVETAMFAAYAMWIVDDVKLLYLGWFYLACPMLIIWVGLSTTLSTWHWSGADWIKRGLCAGIAYALIANGVTANLYRGLPPDWASALPRGDVRITARGGNSWPIMLGMFEYSRRQGDSPCFLDPNWRVLVTDDGICDESDDGRIVEMFGTGELRPPAVLYDNGTVAIADAQ